MSQERASERFHRMVYSHLQACPSDSRDKAWGIVAENHKQLYADYQAETAANEAAEAAASVAAESAKTKAANERRARMEAVTDAVEQYMHEHPTTEYGTAYQMVQAQKPHLFSGMQGPKITNG